MKTKKAKKTGELYTGFSARIVGSSKRNMIVQKGNSPYDTDIQIEWYSNASSSYLPSMKKDFFDIIKVKSEQRGWTANISTSVITIKKLKEDKFGNKVLVHSFDLAIIRPNQNYIAKGKEDNNYNWNQLSSNMKDAYKAFKGMDHNKINDVKQRYINKKCVRPNSKEHKDYKSSTSLFIEAINEVLQP